MEIDLEQEKSNLENVEVKEITYKQKGLFAKRNFKCGELIFTVHGDTVNYATGYAIPVAENILVEPRLSGSIAQYMNHSCEPNIGPNAKGENESDEIRNYVAIRDIQRGEELKTNYGFLGYEYGHEKTIDGKSTEDLDLTCHCNTTNCKGILGSYKTFSEDEKIKWKDYTLPFLLKYTSAREGSN